MATQNITLDGSTSFSAFDSGTYTWNAGTPPRIENAFIGTGTPTEDNTLNVSLNGPEWRVRQLSTYNDSAAFDFDVNITDTNDGVLRRIDRLQLTENGDSTVTLFSTRVKFIEGGEGGTVTLNLGSRFVNLIELGGITNTITGGTGGIGALKMFAGGTSTVTLNAGSDSITWDDGNTTLTLNAGFHGAVTGYSENYSVNTITVGANAQVRSIGVSNGRDTVNVAGDVEQIQTGANDDTVTVTGRVSSLLLGDGNNTFTLDGDHAWAVTAFSGNDTASINQGQIDQLYLGGGNNVVTLAEGAFVGSLRVNEGADRLTVNGGSIQQAALGSGANTVTVNGGSIEQLTTYEGADRIQVNNGQIFSINVSGGDNRVVTGDQWTSSVVAFDGRDTVIVGSGGAGSVQVGGGRNIVTTTTGFVDYINTQNEVDVVTIGAGGALNVVTSGGNDRINATAGRVDFIDAGEGGDLVALGAGGARFVVLGDGNDTINVAAFNPDWGVVIQGDAGLDTLAFTGFDTGITFSLDVSDWQNPGAPGGNPDVPGTGYVSAINFENLSGSAGSDSLTGSNVRNTLTGGVGLDTLNGLDGNDRLIGGRQADLLFGGNGRDVFVFNPNEGIDRIGDFLAGQDTIELLAANALADLTFQQIGADVRISFEQNVIFVANTTVAVMNDIDNFVF